MHTLKQSVDVLMPTEAWEPWKALSACRRKASGQREQRLSTGQQSSVKPDSPGLAASPPGGKQVSGSKVSPCGRGAPTNPSQEISPRYFLTERMEGNPRTPRTPAHGEL